MDYMELRRLSTAMSYALGKGDAGIDPEDLRKLGEFLENMIQERVDAIMDDHCDTHHTSLTDD